MLPDDDASSSMACKYDVLGIADRDEEEETKQSSVGGNNVGTNPFVRPIMNALTFFNKTPDETRPEPMPVEQAVKSK